jgi:hypothetical protein
MPESTRTKGAPFDPWIGTFRARVIVRGITDEIRARAVPGTRPGTTRLKEIRNQRKIGMDPANGYAAVGLLVRLRQGP